MAGGVIIKLIYFLATILFAHVESYKKDFNERPRIKSKAIIFPDEIDSYICKTPNGSIGFCVLLQECQSLYMPLRTNRVYARAFMHFVRRSTCGYKGISLLVCCPHSRSKTPPTPDKPKSIKKNPLLPKSCGINKDSLDRIAGGRTASKGSRPWMALLGGYSSLKGKLDFHCTGSLITNRHILTAAHCYDDKFNLTTVRLGEHDLDDSSESVHEDFLIKNITKHEAYFLQPGRPTQIENDIAILTLDRTVNFADNISPICLPREDHFYNDSFEGKGVLVAGWGATEIDPRGASPVLLEAYVKIQALDVCRKNYSSQLVINDRQLCASDKGKDSCGGDSGGPLMFRDDTNKELRYVAIGIVSIGPKCSKLDSNLPGVYTKITSFMDWIEQNLQ